MASTRRSSRSRFRWVALAVLVVGFVALAWYTRSRENAAVTTSNSANAAVNRAAGNSTPEPTNTSFSLIPDAPTNTAPTSPPKTTDDLPKDESACAQAEGGWVWRSGRCWPTDEPTCESADGIWSPPNCLIRTADSGKACRDDGECIGVCLVGAEDVRDRTERDDELTDVTGSCAPRIPIRGCVIGLSDGRPTQTCFD